MKYFIIVIMSGFLFWRCSYRNDPDPMAAEPSVVHRTIIPDTVYKNPELVHSIYQKAAHVDSIQFTDSIALENEEFMENMTDGGGSVTGYFHSGQLVRIRKWIGLSYGILTTNFYFSEGRLIYVLENEWPFYTDANGTDHSRFSETNFSGDYFFAGEQLIEKSVQGEKRFEATAAETFPETARQLKTILLQKRKRNQPS